MHANIITNNNRFTNELIAFRAEWIHKARPEQLAPGGNWRIWLALAGRGWGKTKTGAEHSLAETLMYPKRRWAVIAPTNNDCRRVCFEGESGLWESLPKYFRDRSKYNRAELEIRLPNESMLIGYSAEKPDRLRGPQHHGGWGDEVASWGAAIVGGKAAQGPRLKETWSNYEFGLRLGDNPRTIITTTPRPIKFVRDLVDQSRGENPRVRMSTGSTFDNAANLAASAVEDLMRIYDGTRLGRQELYAAVLSENENALWKASQFEAKGFRVSEHPELERTVVAVDPAVTTADDSDETGIVVAGRGVDGQIYIVGDFSGKYRPHEWAKVVLGLYERYHCSHVVAETNQGGDLVESNLRAHSEDDFFYFKGIHAKKGKYLRAEPVAAYYEKGRVHHVGRMDKLESQMTDFTGSLSEGSPDRLDAAVYAATELILGTSNHAFF